MIVKIFNNKGGGSGKASMDYLLGKDRLREGAEVISGNPELSVSIAESLEFKNKYTVGCLSFEEKEIPKITKKEIMERFESTVFAGLDKEQYNITWVEHQDKGRIELNFFIPNVEMESRKRLQPYYDKVDRPMIDSFKKVINHEYGLSSPDDYSKKQLLQLDHRTPPKINELKRDLTAFFVERISEGKITDRQQIVETITNAGYEVVRETDNAISLKNPEKGGRNIRLSGEIYEKEFYEKIRDAKELGYSVAEARERREKADRENNARDYERAKNVLAEGIDRRTARHQEIFKRKDTLVIEYSHNNHFIERVLGASLVANRTQTESNRRIEDNRTSHGEIQSLSGNRGTGDYEQRGWDIHIEQVPKSDSLQERTLHSDPKIRKIKSIDELLERTRKLIESTRIRAKELYEKIREVTDGFGNHDDRKRRTAECLGKIDETDRHIERTKQTIAVTDRSIEQRERTVAQADKELKLSSKGREMKFGR